MACRYEKQCTSYLGGTVSCTTFCKDLGATANPTRGETGEKGADGTGTMYITLFVINVYNYCYPHTHYRVKENKKNY